MRFDHGDTLDALAARYGRSPLEVIEDFLCAAALREHEGMSREYAEREAVRDVAALLSSVPVASVSPAVCGSAASQMQSFSTSNPIAEQSVSREAP